MWLFMLPSVLVMTLVLLYPFGTAVYYSFLDYYLGSPEVHFVGLANYTTLLGEQRFWGDLATTFIIVGCSVALQFVVGLAIALALYALTSRRAADLAAELPAACRDAGGRRHLPEMDVRRALGPAGCDADLAQHLSARLAGRSGLGEGQR